MMSQHREGIWGRGSGAPIILFVCLFVCLFVSLLVCLFVCWLVVEFGIRHLHRHPRARRSRHIETDEPKGYQLGDR